MSRGFELEVCVDRIDTALLAARAGATRIEYNSALALGGLSPSVASCKFLVEELPIPVVAMLRPHDRSFVYTDLEKESLLEDAVTLAKTGIAAIVFGALTREGRIDESILKNLAASIPGLPIVFHRAFDEVQDQFEALDVLLANGVVRVLTSGGAETAWQGRARLKALQEKAEGRIEILPGSGVHESNAAELLLAVGCRQLHGSFGANRTAPITQIEKELPEANKAFADEIANVRQVMECTLTERKS